jgi:hypothetical protein
VEPEDPNSSPSRYPIPDGLRERAAGLAKWMQTVGILQTCCAGLAFALFSCSVIGIVAGAVPLPVVIITVIVLAMLAILVRQGLLLQSAADHLKSLGDEPDDAHDHLQLAFARLRPMFAIDVALGVMLLLRNGLMTWGAS